MSLERSFDNFYTYASLHQKKYAYRLPQNFLKPEELLKLRPLTSHNAPSVSNIWLPMNRLRQAQIVSELIIFSNM
jgi:hypothetical protein